MSERMERAHWVQNIITIILELPSMREHLEALQG